MNLFLLPCWKKCIWKGETVPNDVDAEGNIDNSVEGSDTNDLLEEEADEGDHVEWNIQNAAEC